jgi:hypothetical protein
MSRFNVRRPSMRRYSGLQLLMLAGLFATQGAVAAVPCVTPKAQTQAAVPGRVVDCRDSGSLRTGKCMKNDQADAVAPALALDMPAPLPVLIVARAEDVAEWHAEIFEHLSQEPLAPTTPRGNCSLTL